MRDIQGAYKVLANRDIYLPTFHSKCITEEYIVESLKGNLFYIPLKKVTLASLKDTTMTKEKLFEIF